MAEETQQRIAELRDKIRQKAEHQRKTADIMENVSHNSGNWEHAVEDAKEKGIDYLRLLENNARMGESWERSDWCFLTYQAAINGKIGPHHTRDALGILASAGDELSNKMLIFFNELGHPYADLALNKSDILEKLITRKMTEKEYNGYLRGELSIGNNPGEQYYLPQGESVLSVRE